MKMVRILILLCIFLIGGLGGFFIKNFPLIKWNQEIKIYEAAQVTVTLFIGLCIPFFVKKWIEDKRHLKNSLIDECKNCELETRKIKDKLSLCFKKGEILATDKEEITILFSDSDTYIENLIENLQLTFNSQSKDVTDNIKDSYMLYWKMVTGGQLMSVKYEKIDDIFYRSQQTQYAIHQKSIRQAIIKIQSL